MSKRFTETDKWADVWFSNLKPIEKIVFLYLCDNCDIAGFYEINLRRMAHDINTDVKTIEGAIKGLDRGLIYSESNEKIFVRNFIKHQKNYPLNEKNNCHNGIIERLENNKKDFNFYNIEEYFLAPNEGLASPIGKGKGNGKGLGISNSNELTWKKDFEIYKSELKQAYEKLIQDKEWISERQSFHPNLDILKTVYKSYVDYWNTEAGWKNKKKSGGETINWVSTFNNALTQKMNAVYLSKDDKQKNIEVKFNMEDFK